MRILHTSDWHLGRTFHGVDMIAAQRAFLAHLADVVKSESVDAVLVSGDIYDRAIPSLEAVEALEQGLAQLVPQTQVILSSGNHDSARRLGFASDLLERAGVHLRTRISDITRPVLLDNGRTSVHVYAVPFLEPYTTVGHLADGDEVPKRTHDGVLGAAARRIAQHREANGVTRAVIMSHAWFTGGEASESEIDISMGGIGRASTKLLDGFDYAALGHLHKPQAIEHHIRYSGSPLHYSFSEMGTAKQSFVVDLSGGTPVVTAIDTPTFRSLHEITGDFVSLLNASDFAPFEESFLRIHLTDLPVPEQAANRLRQRFKYLVDLRVREIGGGSAPTAGEFKSLSPLEICSMFLERDRGTRPDDRERTELELAIAHGRRGLVDGVSPENVACEHDEVEA